MVEPVGPGENNPNTYAPLLDYAYYKYMTGTRNVIEENLGALGERLEAVQQALPFLNIVYDVSSDTNVEIDMNGKADVTTAGDLTAANKLRYQSAVRAIFQGSDDTVNEDSIYNKIWVLLGSKTLSTSSQFHVGELYKDLTSWKPAELVATSTGIVKGAISNYGTSSKWAEWYSSSSAHKTMESSVQSLINLNTECQDNLKIVMFLYQQFIKSTSAIFSVVDELQNSFTLNIRT